MSSRSSRGDRTTSSPPMVDESYWAALLQEGDMVLADGEPASTDDWHDHISPPAPGLSDSSADEHVLPSPLDWEDMRQIMDSDETVELSVVGSNRGGLLVQWRSLRGFVPASQLVDFPTSVADYVRRQELLKYLESRLNLRVIELDEAQNRLIFSERAAQVDPGTRDSVLEQLSKGDVCEGIVTNVCDFGVFIDLGGVEGLIHISELSWGRVGHPGDLLKRGQEVRVFVMDITKDEGRVALSIKRLQPDPWVTVSQRYEVGQIVEGVVTNVVDFGAFACIEEGLEGLIHISELAEGHFLHPRNVVREGDTVRARILNIDGPSRRLGLSLRENNHS